MYYTVCTIFSSFAPRSTVLLEKLTGFQLVRKFPPFYVTRGFITAFTNAFRVNVSCQDTCLRVGVVSTSPNPQAGGPIYIFYIYIFTGTRRATTFRSTTVRIYDGNPIVL